jgi:hypothetical protein
MILIKIKEVCLSDIAKNKMSYASYIRATEWLKSWTCENNFKAFLANDIDEANDYCKRQLNEIIPSWALAPNDWLPSYFHIAFVKIDIPENRQFWLHFSSNLNWIDTTEDKSK